MEFVILFCAIIFGFLIGWHARERVAINKVQQILRMAEEAEQEVENATERMRVERHSGVLYAYTDKEEFLGQGADLYELDEVIQKRFPGRKFLIKRENLEEVGVDHERI